MIGKTSRWKILIKKLKEAKTLLPSAPRFGSHEYLRYRKFLGSIISNNDCSQSTRIRFNKLNPYCEPETFKNWGNAIRGLRDSLPHLRDESLKNIGAARHAELEYTTQKIEFALGQLEERFPFLYEIPFDCLLSCEEQKTWREDNLSFIQLVEDEFKLLETHESLTLPLQGKEIPDQEKSKTLEDKFLYLQESDKKDERALYFRLDSEQLGFKRILFEPKEIKIIRFLYDIKFHDKCAMTREEISKKTGIPSKSVGSRIAMIREKCSNTGMPTEVIVKGASPATWMLDQNLSCCSPLLKKRHESRWSKLNFRSRSK